MSPGLAGYRNEFLKLALGSEGMTNDLFAIASRYAQADIPDSINLALRMCKLTAIQKANGKVRGLNAGDTLRRLVCQILPQ